MVPDFSKCNTCGIIFNNPDGAHQQCPKCRSGPPELDSQRDELRLLKNTIRDNQAIGEYMTVPQLSEKTGVNSEQIWHFIRSGEIDTAGFDDPSVRDFLVRKKREQDKLARQLQDQSTGKKQPVDTKKKRSGFHLRSDDDK
jgi:hypothetical protein